MCEARRSSDQSLDVGGMNARLGVQRVGRALDEHHLRRVRALGDVHRDLRARAAEAVEDDLAVADRARQRDADPLVDRELAGAHAEASSIQRSVDSCQSCRPASRSLPTASRYAGSPAPVTKRAR